MALKRVDVAVVLPVWGEWWSMEDLEATVRSIAAQQFGEWRLTVVDATGGREAEKLVRGLVPKACLDYSRSIAGGGTREDCLWQALCGVKALWVAYAEIGAEWDPTHLFRLVSVARLYSLDAVFSGAGLAPFWGAVPDALLRGNFIALPASMHSQRIYRRLGTGWRRGQAFHADWDLWLQMAESSAKFGNIDLDTVRRRRSLLQHVGSFGEHAIRGAHLKPQAGVFTKADIEEMAKAEDDEAEVRLHEPAAS